MMPLACRIVRARGSYPMQWRVDTHSSGSVLPATLPTIARTRTLLPRHGTMAGGARPGGRPRTAGRGAPDRGRTVAPALPACCFVGNAACWRCFLRACRGSGRLPAHVVRLRPPACGDRRGTRPRPYRLSRLRVHAAGCCGRDPELRLPLLATTRHAAPASSDRYGSILYVRWLTSSPSCAWWC